MPRNDNEKWQMGSVGVNMIKTVEIVSLSSGIIGETLCDSNQI